MIDELDDDIIDDEPATRSRTKSKPVSDHLASIEVQCPRWAGNLTISAASCARSYQQAKETQGFKHHACHRCPIGAAHSDGKEPEHHDPLHGSLTCVRCNRSSGERLVLIEATGGICRPCHARELEVRKGRNRKGTVPRQSLPPGTVIAETPSGMQARTLRNTTGHAEMDRSARKLWKGAKTLVSWMIDSETGRPYACYGDGSREYLDGDVELFLLRYSEDGKSCRAEPFKPYKSEPERIRTKRASRGHPFQVTGGLKRKRASITNQTTDPRQHQPHDVMELMA